MAHDPDRISLCDIAADDHFVSNDRQAAGDVEILRDGGDTSAAGEAAAFSLPNCLTVGDPEFGRAYVLLLIDRVKLTADTIRICSSCMAIEHSRISNETTSPTVVPILDQK